MGKDGIAGRKIGAAYAAWLKRGVVYILGEGVSTTCLCIFPNIVSVASMSGLHLVLYLARWHAPCRLAPDVELCLDYPAEYPICTH